MEGFVVLIWKKCQIILQQKSIYSTEDCILRSETMASHMQVPLWHRKENTFIKRKRKLEGLQYTRKPRFFFGWVLAYKEEAFFFLVGLCYSYSGWELPLLVFHLLNWGLWLLFLFYSWEKILLWRVVKVSYGILMW